MSERRVPDLSLCLLKNNKRKKKPQDVRNKAIIIIPLASHIHPCVAFNKWQGPGGEYICYVTVFSSLQSEMTGKWDNCSLHRYFFPIIFSRRVLGLLQLVPGRSSVLAFFVTVALWMRPLRGLLAILLGSWCGWGNSRVETVVGLLGGEWNIVFHQREQEGELSHASLLHPSG